MRKIALVGEDPNDTIAIQNLLSKKFNKTHFRPILRNKTGYQLDNNNTLNALEIELDKSDFDLVIFIRDLDGLESNKQKVREKHEWFNRLNKVAKGNGIFLLNIYEIEALILADIDTFNKVYKTSIKNVGNVMFKIDPKGFLMRLTEKLPKKYKENHCPELFKKLSYDIIKRKCRYFFDFDKQLDQKLKKHPN